MEHNDLNVTGTQDEISLLVKMLSSLEYVRSLYHGLMGVDFDCKVDAVRELCENDLQMEIAENSFYFGEREHLVWRVDAAKSTISVNYTPDNAYIVARLIHSWLGKTGSEQVVAISARKDPTSYEYHACVTKDGIDNQYMDSWVAWAANCRREGSLPLLFELKNIGLIGLTGKVG